MAQLDATQEAEVTFLSGVAADGTLAGTSYWTWNDDAPATYTRNYESKFGDPVAGTGGSIRYAFTAASNWTATEKDAFRSAMALWEAVANVDFVEVAPGTTGVISITRGADRSASGGTTRYIPGTIGTRRLGLSTGEGAISIDTSVRGFGPVGADLAVEGGYPWMTIVHELGHIIGLGHGGPYNDGDTTDSPRFTRYDDISYTIMSYNGTEGRSNYPMTPMTLDIAAAQRLYGLPPSTPLGGGQVFGFNSNIGGSIGKFYDFSINRLPIITLWDAGTGNSLDMSGSTSSNFVHMQDGSSSSILGSYQNLYIAKDTRIDRYVAGSGGDHVEANDDGDMLIGGRGNDTLNGGAGDDVIFAGGGSYDVANGGAGNDTITLDVVGGYASGGSGNDKVVFPHLFRNYNLTRTAPGFADYISEPSAGLTSMNLDSFETFAFADTRLETSADSNAAAVYRLYETVLARAPDALGLDYWARALDRGVPLTDVASVFTGSAEFVAATGGLSNDDFVEYLYRHAFGRASDPGGKANWTSTLGRGVSRAAVAVSFSEGSEQRGLTAAAVAQGLFVDDAEYQAVAALYDGFAGRRPDAGGLAYWGGELDAGRMTLAQIADAFTNSPEFQGRTAGLDNAGVVDFLYHTTLGRDGDPGGRAFWTAQLDNGSSRGGVLMGFAESAEHLGRIASSITGGITVG